MSEGALKETHDQRQGGGRDAAGAEHGGGAPGGTHALQTTRHDERYSSLAALALLLPESVAREAQALVLEMLEEGTYRVGMLDPNDIIGEKNVALAIGVDTGDLRTERLDPAQFEHLFEVAYRSEFAAVAQHGGSGEAHSSVSWRDINPEAAAASAQSQPEPARVVKQGFTLHVDAVLAQASLRGASDIHFKPGKDCGRIYFDIDGVLNPYAEDVPTEEMEKIVRTLADLADVNEYELPYGNKDASIRMVLPVKGGGEADVMMRLAAVPALDGIDVTVRFLNQQFRGFEEMGHEPEQTALYYEALRHHDGIIFATGKTGSGKSTLLEAMARHVEADGTKNVIVIADPIEYENPRRTQIPITAKYSWADALRATLRKAPHVIIVGEIRDGEVAKIAFTAADTGHLILTTLHTNDIASTFNRISNLGIEPFNVGSLVRNITAQKLIRVLCENCKVPDPRGQMIAENIARKVFPDREDIQQALASFSGETPFFKIGRGRGVPESKIGCPACNYRGYAGRTAIAEVMNMTPDIGGMVSLGMRGEQAVEFAVKECGMKTLAEMAARKLVSGVTWYSEVAQWLTPPPERKGRGGATRWGAPAHSAEPHEPDAPIEAEYTVEEAA